jgi:hypothetical protein
MGLLHFRGKLKGFFNLFFNVLQLVSAIATILTISLGATVVVFILRFQYLLLPLAAFAAGIFVSLITFVFTYTRSARSRWLLQGYRWIQAEYLYTIHNDDPSHHSQKVTITLEAIRSGVDHFENRYFWTARGQEEEPQIVSAGHSLMGSAYQRGGWKNYFVHLGHELTKGERVEIIIQQELYDHDGKFEPFLAKTMSEPVDRLLLRVDLPRKNFPTHITCQEESGAVPFNNLVRKLPSTINLGSESGEIRLEIQSPVLGHRYEIRWS